MFPLCGNACVVGLGVRYAVWVYGLSDLVFWVLVVGYDLDLMTSVLLLVFAVTI